MHDDEFMISRRTEDNGMMRVRVRHIKTGIEHSEKFAFISQKRTITKINNIKNKVIEKIAVTLTK